MTINTATILQITFFNPHRLISAAYNSGVKLQPKIEICRMVNNATYIYIEALIRSQKICINSYLSEVRLHTTNE